MILKIADHLTVAEVQDKFNECFPHLKIDFYKGTGRSKHHDPVDGLIRIGEITKKHEHGEIELKSWYKIERVEEQFKNNFGLYVQISILKNGKWIRLHPHEKLMPSVHDSSTDQTSRLNTPGSTDEEIILDT